MNSIAPIFFLIPRLPNLNMKSVGGGELSNILLINQIAKKYKVILIPMISSPNNYKFSQNVKIYKSNFNLTGRAGYFVQKYLLYYKRIHKLAIKYQPKKIIATRSTINSGYRIKLYFKSEFEIIVRAYEDFINIKNFDPFSKSSIFRKIEKFFFSKNILKIYKDVDRFITNSKYMSLAIEKDIGFRVKSLVIYPEIQLPRIKPKFESVKKIGFINRGKKKGLKTIIELSKMYPLVQFFIFGDKINTNQNNIVNMGYFNDRTSMFGLIDMVLVPSIWNEPYGRVASEAIWSGKMVLASNKGGLPEAVTDSFFLVDDVSISEWSKRINEVINNRDLVDSLILKAQNILTNHNLHYH